MTTFTRLWQPAVRAVVMDKLNRNCPLVKVNVIQSRVSGEVQSRRLPRSIPASFWAPAKSATGVVLSRAVHFCDLLRLSPLTRRFVRFRQTRLRVFRIFPVTLRMRSDADLENKVRRVSYVVPKFHELWSTNDLKPDMSFYPPSLFWFVPVHRKLAMGH